VTVVPHRAILNPIEAPCSTEQDKATPSHKYRCLKRAFFALVITVLLPVIPARLLSGLAVVLALSSHVLTHPSIHLHSRPESERHTHLYGSLSLRDSTASEPDDTVSITKMAAVGDSYSAGIGAGDVISDNGKYSRRRYKCFFCVDN
jgi:hypothetical protein